MRKSTSKNAWVLLLLMLAGIVIGGLIGTLADGVAGLDWLNYGQSFGIDKPIELNLGVLIITFGLSIKITIASILGMILAGVAYRFV